MSRGCLLTGAGGFLGGKLARALKRAHYVVRGIDLGPGGGECDQMMIGDITKPLNPVWFKDMGTVVHLAGKVHALSETHQDQEEYFRINTLGTQNVLEAARVAGVRRFILYSTVKAMSRDKDSMTSALRKAPGHADGGAGHFADRPWTELDEIEPDTPYGQSKLEAEKLVLKGGFVPQPVVLRLCMVYGPGAKGNIAKMIGAVLRHRFPPPPSLANKRSMVHVDDVVQATLLSIERPEAAGETFIVSDGFPYSTRLIYELICTALNRRVPGWQTPLFALKSLAKIGDLIGNLRNRRFIFDSDALEKLIGDAWFSEKKIASRLGFKPRRTMHDSISEMVAWVKQAGSL